MKISQELSNQLAELTISLYFKFGISVGYSHPMGEFSNAQEDDFILYITGDFDEDGFFTETGQFLIEANEFEQEFEGFMSKITSNLEQRSEKIDNFLIDLHLWLKTGQLVQEEWRTFGENKWRQTGDGRFEICGPEYSYMKFIDEFRESDLKNHIYSHYTEWYVVDMPSRWNEGTERHMLPTYILKEKNRATKIHPV